MNDIEGSIEDYTRALELDPYFTDAYINRGTAKMNMLNYSAQLPDFVTRESVCRDLTMARNLGNVSADKMYVEYCSGDAEGLIAE